MSRGTFSLAFFVLLGIAAGARAGQPWPAESETNATNLTPLDIDFQADLSGAVWNPDTRALWVCRNGTLPDGKLWKLVEDGAGSFRIDDQMGQLAKWTAFGDLEGVTLADPNEEVVYVIIEGEEHIKEYDVSTYGVAVLNNVWFTQNDLPMGGTGAEAITFVPDDALTASGFVDANGVPYTSTGGMNGVMMVGHQTGGGIYVFDLDRTTGMYSFVGAYQTGFGETADLAFDRSTGILYVWHGDVYNKLELLDLTSSPVAGQTYRQFTAVQTFDGPNAFANYEGIAVVSSSDCQQGQRSMFMTIDGGGPTSLLWFQEFRPGCPQPTCLEGDVNLVGGGPEDVLLVNGTAGDANREVAVAVGAAIAIALNPSSAGSGAGRYWLYAWRRPALNPVVLSRGGQVVGCLANPTPFQPAQNPQPFRCIRGNGIPALVCAGVLEINPPNTNAVPWSLTIPNGLASPVVVTLQAVIEDIGASNTLGFSVGNGVVVRVQ